MGWRKRLCAHTHIMSAKSLTVGVQGPLNGPGSSRVLDVLVLSDLYF